jgi:putative transposase
MEREILKKSGGVLCQGGQVKHAFVKAQLQNHPHSMSCAALGVALSGYHAWQERPARFYR